VPVRKVALALPLVLVLLFSALFMFPVQAEEWSTIQVPTSNLCLYGEPSISADGDKIAFLSKAGDTEYDLYVATNLKADLNTDTPTPTPSVPPSNTESFPTTLVATASAGSAVVIGAGLLVYFKKRKH
jgi:hypothetical protein